MQGETIRDATAKIRTLRELIEIDRETDVDSELKVLADIRKWPGRKNCVLLAWQALEDAILT